MATSFPINSILCRKRSAIEYWHFIPHYTYEVEEQYAVVPIRARSGPVSISDPRKSTRCGRNEHSAQIPGRLRSVVLASAKSPATENDGHTFEKVPRLVTLAVGQSTDFWQTLRSSSSMRRHYLCCRSVS
jgi:hypothetical protein